MNAKQKRAWVHVANGALKRCMTGGKSEEKCAASAIQQANAVSARISESVSDALLLTEADLLLEQIHVEEALAIEQGIIYEAATTKARVLGMLRDCSRLMHDQSGRVPKALAEQIDTVRTNLRTKYADILTDEETTEAESAGADTEDPNAATAARCYALLGEASTILRMDDSYSGLQSAIQQAISQDPHGDIKVDPEEASESDTYSMGCYPYIRDVFPDTVVYTCHGTLYQRPWSQDADENITLGGTPTEVEVAYVAVGEAKTAPAAPEDTGAADPPSGVGEAGGAGAGSPVPPSDAPTVDLVEACASTAGAEALREVALREDGTGMIKVIAPGWGSSGYYSRAVLQRDMPKLVHKGLKMFWNHQTVEERKARPERDLRDLAAVIEGAGEYKLSGPDGEGVYAPIRVFAPYREAVKELAPHIGVSICGAGRVKEGQAEGRSGRILEEVTGIDSTDFVTAAGRDGKIMDLFEAARQRAYTAPEAPAPPAPEGEQTVDEKEAQALRESLSAQETRLAEAERANLQLREAIVKRDITNVLQRELGTADIHQMVRDRLTRDLAVRAPVTDYVLDEAAFVQLITEALKAEQAYVAEVSGTPAGRIRGLGTQVREAASIEEAQKGLAASFTRLGMDSKAADVAAAGRL